MANYTIINGIKKLIFLFGLLLIITSKVHSTTVKVSTISAMQNAINAAKSGDTILLANGTYLNNTFTIGNSNITVMAATAGAVYLNGTNAIKITGNNNTFSGFQFTSGTITGSAITINGNNNTIKHLNFNGYNAAHMLMIVGQYNTLTNSNFQNKPAINMVKQGGNGDMVQIIPDTLKPGYNVIRYCSFQHMPGFGGDYGNECIRIGDGVYSNFISRTVVEYCYFEDTGNGDSEAISVKSRENCLRYNTMNNNPDAMFAFRNGDYNVAYSNFFIRSGGIRCKQANNIYCFNNYFESSNSFPSAYLMYFDSAWGNNFNFIHNTFYRGAPIILDSGMKKCTWANNIFYTDTSTIFSGVKKGNTFIGNIYTGTLGISSTTGLTKKNPLLVLNAQGYYGLSATSPAKNAATAGYPAIPSYLGLNIDTAIAFDIQGQPRSTAITAKDIGCDEDTTGIITHHPLSLCEVGPSYLCNSVPVSFISINAKALTNMQIAINWLTTNEIDIDHYTVQHSNEGINFNDIGHVEAKTNNTTSTYSFIDNNAFKGLNYYRVASVGNKGDVEYSDIVHISNQESQHNICLYPNPSKDYINIQGNDIKQVIFSDMSGKVILKINEKKIDIRSLMCGTYIVTVELSNGNRVIEKLIKQ